MLAQWLFADEKQIISNVSLWNAKTTEKDPKTNCFWSKVIGKDLQK